jgi:fructose-specific phosphotransferase system IIA component
MAGVSAACIAPPLATGFAVLMNSKAYSKNERSAGYVNFLLGSTHITEGAIPFAAKNPFLNIPAFMVGSSIAAVLSYMFKISDPAPHGGFIILPLVNHPFLWVLFILIGSIVSGALLALIAGRQYRKHGGLVESAGGMDLITGVGSVDETSSEKVVERNQVNIEEKTNSNLGEILNQKNIFLNITAKDQQEVLHYLAKQAVDLGLASSEDSVFEKYIKREHEGSTGMENGIAIPHAQDDTIKKSSLLIVRLKDPVNWNTFDDKPVDTIISFLIPQKDNGTHLNYLSSTAKLLLHQDFVDRLKASQTGDQIVELFKQYKA